MRQVGPRVREPSSTDPTGQASDGIKSDRLMPPRAIQIVGGLVLPYLLITTKANYKCDQRGGSLHFLNSSSPHAEGVGTQLLL